MKTRNGRPTNGSLFDLAYAACAERGGSPPSDRYSRVWHTDIISFVDLYGKRGDYLGTYVYDHDDGTARYNIDPQLIAAPVQRGERLLSVKECLNQLGE